MRLHVTTILRQYDIGNVQIGQNDITIPRDSDKVFISGTCSRRCTGLMLPMPVYITDVYLHMHGLGKIKRPYFIFSLDPTGMNRKACPACTVLARLSAWHSQSTVKLNVVSVWHSQLTVKLNVVSAWHSFKHRNEFLPTSYLKLVPYLKATKFCF